MLPEYGRNVQIMVNHAKTIENREERNKAADTIVQVMGSMNPPLKDSKDYKHKLWDHLHIIGNFELDIDSPFGEPSPEVLFKKPDSIAYPHQKIRFQHYGKIAELMLAKSLAIEEGDARDQFVKHVANHMKLSYITWNKDSVPDFVIFKAVEDLSRGSVKVKEGTTLYDYKEPIKPQYNTNKKKKGKKMK